MKLIYPNYNINLELKENQVTVLSVENPKVYAEILGDLWCQMQGNDGAFILSDEEKIKSISKEMECIYNPFALNCNDKKVVTKLYQELRERSEESLLCEGAELNARILEYLEQLFQKVPYNLEYTTDFDVTDLLKSYGVKIESAAESLLEKIVEYIKVQNRICGIRNFVFVGIKQYLSVEELEGLYEFVFYEKINVIIIEANHSPQIFGEKCWLLDKDLCIIEL